MAKPFLSVVIPAYNEAERLPLTLIDLDRYLSDQEYSYEILVIDDGSTDKTSEIVRKFVPVIKNLKLINNVGNRGKGAAVKIGMLSSKGNWRLAMDADNGVPIVELTKMLPLFFPEQKADIAIASRAVRGAKMDPPRPILRRFVDRTLNIFGKIILRSKVKDFYIGFHCFSGESADSVFALLKTYNWNYGQEALVLAEKMGFRIAEIPCAGGYVSGSHFYLSHYLQMFWETLRIWWWLKRRRYALSR